VLNITPKGAKNKCCIVATKFWIAYANAELLRIAKFF